MIRIGKAPKFLTVCANCNEEKIAMVGVTVRTKHDEKHIQSHTIPLCMPCLSDVADMVRRYVDKQEKQHREMKWRNGS